MLPYIYKVSRVGKALKTFLPTLSVELLVLNPPSLAQGSIIQSSGSCTVDDLRDRTGHWDTFAEEVS